LVSEKNTQLVNKAAIKSVNLIRVLLVRNRVDKMCMVIESIM